jgi:hypothetical protein
VTVSRAIAAIAILVVAAIVVAAFLTIGPPNRARAEALDRQRLRDLGDAAADLHDDYSVGPLPAALTHLRHDPVSGKPYDYQRLGNTRYRLCATFELATPPDQPNNPEASTFWHHPAGRFCYTLDSGKRVESTL